MENPISDFKMELQGEQASLPPWTVEGVTVDIIVYHLEKVMCVTIAFDQFDTIVHDEGKVGKLYDYCTTVVRRLRETLPLPWKVI